MTFSCCLYFRARDSVVCSEHLAVAMFGRPTVLSLYLGKISFSSNNSKLPTCSGLLAGLQTVLSTPYTVEGDGPAFPCPSYDDPALYGPDGLPTFRPLIIAHRGASGMFPEHTALAYREAARQGADMIECDLAITKVKL